jgi:hypothetical protein
MQIVDLIDRGPNGLGVLEYVQSLQGQAAEAGGGMGATRWKPRMDEPSRKFSICERQLQWALQGVISNSAVASHVLWSRAPVEEDEPKGCALNCARHDRRSALACLLLDTHAQTGPRLYLASLDRAATAHFYLAT